MAVIKIFDTLIFGRTQAQTQERVIAFILNCFSHIMDDSVRSQLPFLGKLIYLY